MWGQKLRRARAKFFEISKKNLGKFGAQLPGAMGPGLLATGNLWQEIGGFAK